MNNGMMKTALIAVMIAGASTFGTGCASGAAGGAGSDRAGRADVVTRSEIDRGQWGDAYELVRTLRPHWLRTRGPDSFENPGQVQVYVDGTRLGAVALLRTLPTTGIERLEWVDPISASGRWGMDHAHGVISITYGNGSEPPML